MASRPIRLGISGPEKKSRMVSGPGSGLEIVGDRSGRSELFPTID